MTKWEKGRRTEKVVIRLTRTEKQAIRKWAINQHLGMSAALRHLIMAEIALQSHE